MMKPSALDDKLRGSGAVSAMTPRRAVWCLSSGLDTTQTTAGLAGRCAQCCHTSAAVIIP